MLGKVVAKELQPIYYFAGPRGWSRASSHAEVDGCDERGRPLREVRWLLTGRCHSEYTVSEGVSMNGTRRLTTPDRVSGSTTSRVPSSRAAVSGATSTSSRLRSHLEPTIFDHAIKSGHDYDAAIREQAAAGIGGEELFLELALRDLRQAADLFRPIHEATNRVDGWVSLELSPKLAYDTASSLATAKNLHARRGAEPLYQDSGNADGVPAIEEAIFAGVPINVTLLFSREQYSRPPRPTSAHRAAGGRRIERARAVGGVAVRQPLGRGGGEKVRPPSMGGLASRWRSAHTRPTVTCWPRTAGSGSSTWAPARSGSYGLARAPRTRASDVLYVKSLAAPHTINTTPEKTLLALADHGDIGAMLPHDGGDAEDVLEQFTQAGVDLDALAVDLQREGATAFVKSWEISSPASRRRARRSRSRVNGGRRRPGGRAPRRVPSNLTRRRERPMTARVAIVTGASSGIGLGITRALLERGYRVVANSRTISDSKDLRPSASLVLVDGDIGKKETGAKVADAAVEHFDHIDLLVNNAGIYLAKPFTEYTPEDFERMISTNVAGYFFVTQQRSRTCANGGPVTS